MHLTREEERMLDGEYGEAVRKAMELIVSIGEALGAERLVPITSAHVSGISVSNIGAEGVELIEWFARHGGRARVRATVNPMGFDLDGVIPRDPREWSLQERLLRALSVMGFHLTLTCAPYEHGNRPGLGEHIAWAESSAVIYANSVLGARSNREGGIVALAAAITGRIYEWGMHLDEERNPRVRVTLRGWRPRDEAEAGLLGALLGLRVREVPLLEARLPGLEEARSLLAAAAAWGSHALIHLEGHTPERRACVKCEKVEVDRAELTAFHEEHFDDIEGSDAVFIGCPHVTIDVMRLVEAYAEKCGGFRIPVLVAAPGVCKLRPSAQNLVILRGTCPVVARLESLGFDKIATNSLKAAFYLPRRHGIRVAVADAKTLLRYACNPRSRA